MARNNLATSRRIRTMLALALLVAIATFGRPAAAQQWAPARFTPIAPPAITAKTAYVLDATAGAALFALDPDEPRAPASLTKIVTALVVLDHAALDEPVQIQQSDVVDENQSRVDLLPGDVLTVRDLLYGLLIPSGNDAALALARHVGKNLPPVDSGSSNDAFVAEMNRTAAALGATHTHFVNAVGLDADGHVSSAHDMAILTASAMMNPVFADIISTVNTVLPSALKPGGYAIHTTNDLLVSGEVEGGKTGTEVKAGGCLVTVSHTSGNLIVSVVLGSDMTADESGYAGGARFTDVRAMLAALPQHYVWIDPAAPDVIP
ncbi:MAG: D-alanyl-D-alanine carboxypeptidase, partial [Thermomicrobiales bacterium]|nr:D-alanyl-D-alanine carboxypeptidase [Thermomicrobiales bacterium]